jgi:hypothetical protein
MGRRFVAGIVAAPVLRADTAYNILALLTGELIGAAVSIWLGRGVARRQRASADTTHATLN